MLLNPYLYCNSIATGGFQNNEKTMKQSNRWFRNGMHGGQWNFKTMKSHHWIVTYNWMAWRTVDFLNHEKTMEHSDHWIMTGWHGEQLDFQNNEKTMEHFDHSIVTGWHHRYAKYNAKLCWFTVDTIFLPSTKEFSEVKDKVKRWTVMYEMQYQHHHVRLYHLIFV